MMQTYSTVGERQRQSCTDCFWCVSFMVVLGFFGTLYVHVLKKGNIDKLYHGLDNQGRVCGVDDGVRDKPYLYWCMKEGRAGVPAVSLKRPICVASCPGSNMLVTDSPSMFKQTLFPSYTIEPACASITGAQGMASYRTIVVMDRYCMPDPLVYPELSKSIAGHDLSRLSDLAVESASSVAAAWPILLGSFFLSVLLGYVYLVLLRHCAEPFVYMTMLLLIGGFGALGVYLYSNAGSLSAQLSKALDTPAQVPDDLLANEEVLTKVAAGISVGLSFLSFSLACCFHRSIAVGGACVEVACDTMFEMPSLLLLPVFKAFFKFALTLILLFGFLLLYSIGEVTDGLDGESPHTSHTQDQNWRMFFYVMVSIWILSFVNALYQFIVAYAAAEYYYTPYDDNRRKDVGCCAIWDGLYIGLILHGGSLALGSLVLTLLFGLQKLLMYLDAKSKNENAFLSCIFATLAWMSTCLKEIVEHLTRNAYIDIAITSNDFCTAARSATSMIFELGGAMLVLNGATFVFTIFGTILIALGAGAFTYAVSTQGTFVDNQSQFDIADPIAPMFVSCGIGALTALSFMHVFDMTSDTLLYCYGYDLRCGSPAETAPIELKELVHNRG